MSPSDSQALSDIRKLHEKDIESSKSRDFESLRRLVSDEAVILPSGEDAIQGVRQIDEWYARMKRSMEDFEVLKYSMDFKDVQVQGDFAFEWGYTNESAKNNKTGEIERGSSKLFRVLRKENGEWKVYRAIWNQ